MLLSEIGLSQIIQSILQLNIFQQLLYLRNFLRTWNIQICIQANYIKIDVKKKGHSSPICSYRKTKRNDMSIFIDNIIEVYTINIGLF